MLRGLLGVLLCSVLLTPSLAQDDAKDSESAKVAFVEPPKSIEEAIERRDKAASLAADELLKAEQAFAEKTAAADKEFIVFLSQLARQAVASGDLPGASKAWEKVLDVDPHDKAATEFFGTINRPEIPKAKIELAIKSDTSDKRRIEFVTESGRRFRKKSNGIWSDTWSDGTKLKDMKETSRNNFRVEIYRDGDPGPHQLDGDRVLWKPSKDTDQWKFIERGYWAR